MEKFHKMLVQDIKALMTTPCKLDTAAPTFDDRNFETPLMFTNFVCTSREGLRGYTDRRYVAAADYCYKLGKRGEEGMIHSKRRYYAVALY